MGTELFDDVEVNLSQLDGGVQLRFLVRERPNIRGVEYEGNEELESETSSAKPSR